MWWFVVALAEEPQDSWWERAARPYGPELCAPVSTDLDQDGTPDRWAAYGEQDFGTVHVLVQAGSSRWVVGPVNAVVTEHACRPAPAITLTTMVLHQGTRDTDLAVRDGRVVVLRRRRAGHGSSGEVTDWVTRTEGETSPEGTTTSESAVLVVGDHPPVETRFDIFSKGDLEQRASATVQAIGAEGPPTLRINVEDDQRVDPEADTPEALVSADHVEIWCATEDREAVQLGVALDGTTMWLHHPDAPPVPEVSVDEGTLVVPWPSTCHWRENREQAALTVVVSDSDGNGQQSLTATSRVEWGVLESLGSVHRFDDNQRLPSPFWPVRKVDSSESEQGAKPANP